MAENESDTHSERFDELARRVRQFRDDRDWLQFHRPKDLAISIALEAAELLEHFQWKTDAEVEADLREPGHRDELAREMADVLILLVSAADVLDVDLLDAAFAKVALNAEKYPVERSRGNARKYDRL